MQKTFSLKQAKEIALISAIVSDAHLNSVINEKKCGYFDALDIITDAAFCFFFAFKKQLQAKGLDWSEECEKHGASCYDELVMSWTAKYIHEKHQLNLTYGN